VPLDPHGLPGELLDLGIGDTEPPSILRRHLHGGHRGRCAILRIDHLEGLCPERPAQDSAATGRQGRLVNIEFIGIYRALHECLAEPVPCRDEDHVTEARVGVQREHDPARAEVCTDHLLDSHGERHLPVVEAVVAEPLDVEQRVLLPGKGGLGKVFGRRRGANRHRYLLPVAEGGVGRLDLHSQRIGKRSRLDPAADVGSGTPERADVVHVQPVERPVDTLTEAVVGQETAIGQRRDREAAGHVDPFLGERADHLSERGVLASDCFDVVSTDGFEGDDVLAHRRFPCSMCI
jgi:hypothetical protein